MEKNVPKAIPEGSQFLALVFEQVRNTETISDERLPQWGEKIPKALEEVGTGISLIYRASICKWGCSEGDHVLERIAGRVVNLCASSLLLCRAGYYDESLSLVRTLGEIANLLLLFAADNSSLEEWKRVGNSERRRSFAPVMVRKRLEKCRKSVPANKDWYGLLSGRYSHLEPSVFPGMHNPGFRSVVGSTYQDLGAVSAINELLLPLSVALETFSELMEIPDDVAKRFKEHAKNVRDSRGGLSIGQRDQVVSLLLEAELSGEG